MAEKNNVLDVHFLCWHDSQECIQYFDYLQGTVFQAPVLNAIMVCLFLHTTGKMTTHRTTCIMGIVPSGPKADGGLTPATEVTWTGGMETAATPKASRGKPGKGSTIHWNLQPWKSENCEKNHQILLVFFLKRKVIKLFLLQQAL